MSKSRASKRRAKRRSDHARRTGRDVVSVSTAEFEQLLTDRDLRLLADATRAEQRGDLTRALSCLRRTPRPLGNPWDQQLTEMIELGDSAEPWQWARFCVAAASRWVCSLQLPLVARVLREVSIASEGADGPVFAEYPGWVAGRSALYTAVGGLLLFDELMLEVFLVQVAPALAERSGGGRTWARTRGRVYELIGVDGIELEVRDHTDGRTLTVRHLGEVVGLAAGDLVYGHIIEVPGEPGLIFAMAPIVVDEIVAQRLERLVTEDPWDIGSWCAALGAAVRSGDPYRRPALDVDDEPSPRVCELMGDGLSRMEAEQLVRVEVVITACNVTAQAAPAGAFHAGVALAHQRVFEETLRRYTAQEHETTWCALAEASHGRERSRFVQLAEASRAHESAA